MIATFIRYAATAQIIEQIPQAEHDEFDRLGYTMGGMMVFPGNQVDRNQGRVGPGGSVTEVERVPVERNVERCRTVNEVREATLGYDVRYEYGGRQFQTRMDRDPGRNLRS